MSDRRCEFCGRQDVKLVTPKPWGRYERCEDYADCVQAQRNQGGRAPRKVKGGAR